MGRSFSFLFLHPSWPGRILVGGLLEVVPLLVVFPAVLTIMRAPRHLRLPTLATIFVGAGLALVCRWVQLGYMRRIAEAVLAGTEQGLPPWDRFDTDLTEGFKLWLVGLGISLPVLGIAASLLLLFAALGIQPLGWVLVLLTLPVAAGLTLFYLPGALLATVAETSLLAAFDVSRVMARIGRVLAPYLLAVVVAFATEVLAQLGLLLACVGIFFARFSAHCITVHAFASAWTMGAPSAQPEAVTQRASGPGATNLA